MFGHRNSGGPVNNNTNTRDSIDDMLASIPYSRASHKTPLGVRSAFATPGSKRPSNRRSTLNQHFAKLADQASQMLSSSQQQQQQQHAHAPPAKRLRAAFPAPLAATPFATPSSHRRTAPLFPTPHSTHSPHSTHATPASFARTFASPVTPIAIHNLRDDSFLKREYDDASIEHFAHTENASTPAPPPHPTLSRDPLATPSTTRKTKWAPLVTPHRNPHKTAIQNNTSSDPFAVVNTSFLSRTNDQGMLNHSFKSQGHIANSFASPSKMWMTENHLVLADDDDDNNDEEEHAQGSGFDAGVGGLTKQEPQVERAMAGYDSAIDSENAMSWNPEHFRKGKREESGQPMEMEHWFDGDNQEEEEQWF
ncbi:hypothetical protein HDU98_011442 [Podochytrium sp. JEL0797]|nr:hypothetical protein HDU98_011442 [Podochytrium sp. JEL0797]